MVKKCNSKREIILKIVERRTSMKVKELLMEAEKRNIEGTRARDIIKSLLGSGKIYQPHRGVVERVEY